MVNRSMADGAYPTLQRMLFSVAYRMLGSVAEAEDIVQEAFVRFYALDADRVRDIESVPAYLTAVVTRLSIDYLRSARARREQYVGTWLPEPLVTENSIVDGARYVEQLDSLSIAFLVVLERLSPLERAVFLLHDIFDYSYPEISRMIGKSATYCRQLAVRARRHVQASGRRRTEISENEQERLARRFFAAVGDGDVAALVDLLVMDAAAYGDGGGQAPAARIPICGRDRVAAFLASLGRTARRLGVRYRVTEINRQPGALFFNRSGQLLSVAILDIGENGVGAVYSIVNPDKLQHLGPVGDVRELLRKGVPS